MNYFIKGTISSHYNDSDIVKKLGNFILDNPSFFKTLCDVLIRAKKKEKRQELIKIIIESDTPGKLDSKKIGIFKELLNEFFQQQHIDSGRIRGQLIEYIIAAIGPVTIQDKTFNIVRKCWVENEHNQRIGGANNFDVGFYRDYKCIEELQAELIESKLDLNNFLAKEPFNPSVMEMKEHAKNKLDYMKNVQRELEQSEYLVIALATIRYDLELSKRLLKAMGYTTITLFDFNYLNQALLNTAS